MTSPAQDSQPDVTQEQRDLISEAAEAVELIPEDELEDYAQKLREGGLL